MDEINKIRAMCGDYTAKHGGRRPTTITVSEEFRRALLNEAKAQKEPACSNRNDLLRFPEYFTLFGILITTPEREKMTLLKGAVDKHFLATLRLAAELYPRRSYELQLFVNFCEGLKHE